MGGKREDYISWDEYFMGVPSFPGCVPRILIRRWEPVL